MAVDLAYPILIPAYRPIHPFLLVSIYPTPSYNLGLYPPDKRYRPTLYSMISGYLLHSLILYFYFILLYKLKILNIIIIF